MELQIVMRKLIMEFISLHKGDLKIIRCCRLGVEELVRLGIKEERITRLEFYMIILRNIKKQLNTMRNFYKFVKVLVIVMEKH
jgi:hypothetical protein